MNTFFLLFLIALAIGLFAWVYLSMTRKAPDTSPQLEKTEAPTTNAAEPRQEEPARIDAGADVAVEAPPQQDDTADETPEPPAADEKPDSVQAEAPTEPDTPAPEAAEPEAEAEVEKAENVPAQKPSEPLFVAPEGPKDKLTDIKGIGPVAERQLNEQGITTFAQIAGLSDADIERMSDHMPFSAKQIRDWLKQARERG